MRNDFALLVLRSAGLYLALGHGWGKVLALSTGEGRPFIEGVEALGFPMPIAFAWAAALAELLGGLGVAFGLFTRWSAGAAAFTMFVAAFARHHAHEHALVALGLVTRDEQTIQQWGKPELALLYLCIFGALMLLGPGRISLDGLLRGKPSGARRR